MLQVEQEEEYLTKTLQKKLSQASPPSTLSLTLTGLENVYDVPGFEEGFLTLVLSRFFFLSNNAAAKGKD